MKKYNSPKLEIKLFEKEKVLTESSGPVDPEESAMTQAKTALSGLGITENLIFTF